MHQIFRTTCERRRVTTPRSTSSSPRWIICSESRWAFPPWTPSRSDHTHMTHVCSRPQESISDFYWYYSGKDVIDEQGQRNFSKAINVAKQVFNTLTEYIQVRPICVGRQMISIPWKRRRLTVVWFQGPCTGNQQSLAHSRLWDAVVGFLHVFAHMQMKLSQVNVFTNALWHAEAQFSYCDVIYAAGFKPNRAVEGAHGSSEGYGCDALVHVGGSVHFVGLKLEC